jgi:hypothetical protein
MLVVCGGVTLQYHVVKGGYLAESTINVALRTATLLQRQSRIRAHLRWLPSGIRACTVPIQATRKIVAGLMV